MRGGSGLVGAGGWGGRGVEQMGMGAALKLGLKRNKIICHK